MEKLLVGTCPILNITCLVTCLAMYDEKSLVATVSKILSET